MGLSLYELGERCEEIYEYTGLDEGFECIDDNLGLPCQDKACHIDDKGDEHEISKISVFP